MKATIYVVTSRRERDDRLYRHFTWEEAKEMYDSGLIDIQSHTHNAHYKSQSLPVLSYPTTHESTQQYEDRVRYELRQSKKEIEENLGNNVISLAYPYGSYNQTALMFLSDLQENN
jgi:peptidoglycan/xylan/chitin deacetylase (PgdA/CDA1 family)